MLESFATNAPNLHYWTLNSCFGAFLSVRVLFGPFRYGTKLGAKRAKLVQLMQMFMPRCRARIFRNERSRSTPLDPNLMFSCVFFYVGVFGTILLLHETCCKTRKTGAINVKVCATKSCRNFSKRLSQSTPSETKLMFWSVSFRLGAFGTVSLLHENAPNWCN